MSAVKSLTVIGLRRLAHISALPSTIKRMDDESWPGNWVMLSDDKKILTGF